MGFATESLLPDDVDRFRPSSVPSERVLPFESGDGTEGDLPLAAKAYVKAGGICPGSPDDFCVVAVILSMEGRC